MALKDRLSHAWNAFRNPVEEIKVPMDYGVGYGLRPDRARFSFGNERSIIASIYNRIGIDVSSISFQHVRVDQNGRYDETIKSGINYCLTTKANIDQTGRSFIQDITMSLCDEGTVAIVPIETTLNPKDTSSFDVTNMRVGRITDWYPQHVRVEVYNEKTGRKERIVLPKTAVAIVENPFYSVMNEPNSTLKRLVRKLNLLDVVDENNSSGKLDIIVQLPYPIKSQTRQEQAEMRRKAIEEQLVGSRYGIAYTDATERITQLNRPAENNLLSQIQYLTSMLYSQLGITEEILNGTATEEVTLSYNTKTIEPIATAIANAIDVAFITKTARTQGQKIMCFRDPFKLVPAEQIAEIADKFTRNEIMSSNEIRAIIGYKPVDDPRADELRNKNLNASSDQLPANIPNEDEDVIKEEERKSSK